METTPFLEQWKKDAAALRARVSVYFCEPCAEHKNGLRSDGRCPDCGSAYITKSE